MPDTPTPRGDVTEAFEKLGRLIHDVMNSEATKRALRALEPKPDAPTGDVVEAVPCRHHWEYVGTHRGGSRKGEDQYRCSICGAREDRPDDALAALADPRHPDAIERITAWLYAREGGVAFEQLPAADQEHWRKQAREVAALADLRHDALVEALVHALDDLVAFFDKVPMDGPYTPEMGARRAALKALENYRAAFTPTQGEA